MANLSVLDSTGATKYLKESGAGTNPDPHIGVHSIDQTTPGTTNGVVVNNAAAGSAVNIQDGGNTITVDGAVTAVVSGTVTAAAQPGVDIGDVTINNAGAGSAVNIQDGGNTITVDGTVAVTGAYQAIQPVSIDQTTPGTTNGVVINSGTVTTVTTVSAVTAIGTITPGVAATSLGKAEDAQHASGDVGVMAMAVRADTAVALAAHDNDYAPLEVDATGHLHVAQMASEVHLGAVGGKTVTVTVTPALSVAGAYAANDFVGTDHTGMTFANATRINAGSGVIESAVLIDYALQSAACELWLFDVTPAGLPNDNDAFTITDAAALTCIGVIPFSTYYASALNSVSVAKGLGMAFTAVGAVDDIYGVLVTRGTPTYANGDISIRLQIMQD